MLLDDREERAGIKFKDADLIGVPFRVTIGEKGLNEGNVELFERKTGQREVVKLTDIVPFLKKRVDDEKNKYNEMADDLT